MKRAVFKKKKEKRKKILKKSGSNILFFFFNCHSGARDRFCQTSAAETQTFAACICKYCRPVTVNKKRFAVRPWDLVVSSCHCPLLTHRRPEGQFESHSVSRIKLNCGDIRCEMQKCSPTLDKSARRKINFWEVSACDRLHILQLQFLRISNLASQLSNCNMSPNRIQLNYWKKKKKKFTILIWNLKKKKTNETNRHCGRRQESCYPICDINFPKALPPHAPPLRLRRRELRWSNTQTVTAKHEHDTNAQKARHFFPPFPRLAAAPSAASEPVWAVASVHLFLLPSASSASSSFPCLWDDGAARRLAAEAADAWRLAARQSAVKVDVAQVFGRPLRQAHLVVVVDHPPAGRQRNPSEMSPLSTKCIVANKLGSQGGF